MADNKIVLSDGTVLIDLTADTIDASHMAKNYKAHDKSGTIITGTAEMVYTPETEELTVPDWMVTING